MFVLTEMNFLDEFHLYTVEERERDIKTHLHDTVIDVNVSLYVY